MGIAGLGVPELLIILVIVLVIFGASRLTDIMGAMGKGIKEFRNASKEDMSDKPEANDTHGDQVHLPIGHLVCLENARNRANGVRLGRPADLLPFLDEDDAKTDLFIQAAVYHLLIARLENTQRQRHARKEDRL